MARYAHRQYGLLTAAAILTVAIAVIAVIVTVGVGATLQERVVISVVVCAVALTLFLFNSLLVRVSAQRIELRFGPGLIRKNFDLGRVDSVAPVRNHWYYGWGIRLTPHGWLFNISGLDAVEIRMTDGRTFRIGTDQPHELMRAIDEARAAAGRA